MIDCATNFMGKEYFHALPKAHNHDSCVPIHEVDMKKKTKDPKHEQLYWLKHQSYLT